MAAPPTMPPHSMPPVVLAPPPPPGGAHPGPPPLLWPDPNHPGAYVAATAQAHGLVLASAGSRLAARLIDIFAVTILCAIANFWVAAQFWKGMGPVVAEVLRRSRAGEDPAARPLDVPAQAQTLIYVSLIVIVAVWFAYEVFATANSGQTLGKRLMRIKVMRIESAEPLGFGRAWRRWSRLGMPTLLWPCCFFGLGLQILDCLGAATDRPLRQAIHDKVAGTVVVQAPRPGGPDAHPREP
jgi:uncharacterized RDD family membrane protein YckC